MRRFLGGLSGVVIIAGSILAWHYWKFPDVGTGLLCFVGVMIVAGCVLDSETPRNG